MGILLNKKFEKTWKELESKGLRFTDDGYEFESQNGVRYSLYEGLTIGGLETKTSDQLFIMFDGYDDSNFFWESGYDYTFRLVDFMAGASFVDTLEWLGYINE